MFGTAPRTTGKGNTSIGVSGFMISFPALDSISIYLYSVLNRLAGLTVNNLRESVKQHDHCLRKGKRTTRVARR